jgi:hypothetical protein
MHKGPFVLLDTTAALRAAHGCAFELVGAGLLQGCTSLSGAGGGEGSISLTGGFCL